MKPLIIVALLFTTFVNAQIVTIPDANFKAELILQGFDINSDGEIQLIEAQSQTYLEITTNTSIASLEGIQSFTNLTNLRLTGMPLLTSLDISGLTDLQYFNLGDMPQLNGFSLQNLPQLYSLSIGNIASTSLDFSNLTGLYGISLFNMPALTSLNMAGNTSVKNVGIMDIHHLGSINLSGCTGLIDLLLDDDASSGSYPEMVLNSVNLTGCTAVKSITIKYTSLAALDVSDCTALQTFTYADNHVPNLDLSGLTNLQTVRVTPNTFSNTLLSLNLNGCTALNSVYASSNTALKSLYLKNGRNEGTITLADCFALSFVCVDDSQLSAVQTLLTNQPLPNAVCNSYCSFTPGGNYNTITGSLTFDANNNGCDAGDPIQSNIKVNLGSPVIGATCTNGAGNYTFYTDAGTFQWIPGMENPNWFTIAPALGTTTFANNNNNFHTQNFCIAANGVHPDLEVVVSPIGNARPGFASNYKVVYKNKGNQTLSGNVKLAFDDSRLDFVAASPTVDVLGINSLDWSYSDLLPFESRFIVVVFDVNTPSDIPAVNIGDVLHFASSITPVAGDELPSDNAFSYNQTVVGPMDPNGIICLEGNSVSPSEIGNYLHYVISFENTGNFQAENVVAKVTVDTNKYDINSLQLLNTSNSCYTRINGNVAEFIFENINLAPVNGSPPVGGHGDVLFKIKSKNTLVSGNQVAKSSKIYFDYNMPITTNTAQTTYQNLSNSVNHRDDSITIYPNPASSTINIHCNSAVKTIELYDIHGRLLETDYNDASTVIFDISSKQSGIYFLKITSDEGSKVEKIVKE